MGTNLKAKPTRIMIGDLIRESGRFLSTMEIISGLESKFYVKKTKQQIRNAVNAYDCKDIVRIGTENYDLLSSVVNGLYFRYTLSSIEIDKGILNCDEELCFIFNSVYRKDDQKIILRSLEDSISTKIKFCGAKAIPRRIIEGLDGWYKKCDLCAGDDIIIKVVDYDAAVYEIAPQKKEVRDDELISIKNKEVTEILFSIAKRINAKGDWISDLTKKVICEYPYKHECPPDTISRIAKSDSRFVVNDKFHDRVDGIYLKSSFLFDDTRSTKTYRGPILPKKSKTEWIYQFRISLNEIEPHIWRRIQVPSNYSFWDLHVAIQDAMGWQDYHLHEFRIKSPRTKKEAFIGIPFEEDYDLDRKLLPGWHELISSWFSLENSTAEYIYDFGDNWQHTVKLEGMMLCEKDTKYPRCIDGKRSCPPEDVGSTWGYMDFLEAIKNPTHTKHQEWLTWAGGSFDPEKFEPNNVKFDDPDERFNVAFKDN